ncbi:MAG: FAD:protein FMN transferase [Nitrospirae bacterium]|nr:FAD:protein FMN transferase [Nitrospirota bacterium]
MNRLDEIQRAFQSRGGTSFLLGLLLLAVIPSCGDSGRHTYQKSRAMMDTFVTMTVISESRQQSETAIQAAFNSIEEFGCLINFFSATSELSQINKNAGVREVRVSPAAFDLIEKALYVADKSAGAFDPTIGPVMRLWDFHNGVRPPDADIKKNLPLVNYRDVVINKKNSGVFLRKKGMLLDLGGIAKGYAADLAVGALKQHGITAGIVAVGGDVRTFGLRADGTAWNVGIKNPRQTGAKDEIMGTIRLTDKAISTSGDYERYFISDGRRFHHILDPQTGYPSDRARSVSIIARDGVFTDGFDTAVFVLGPRRGLDLIKEINRDFEVDAIIIDVNGVIYETDRVKETIKDAKNL